MSKTLGNQTVEWNKVNWRKLEKTLYKLQKRIFRASQRGDTRAVRKLQKTLMKSWTAKMIAVRRVTQENKGKNTAGIDEVKSLKPEQRPTLVASLNVSLRAKPTRRVWIPKPGRLEKRPLSIPTMYDRALQALTKLALEPEWEAKFEPNSYGFRPGRSCHDAIEAIFNYIRQKPKWVLDADIAKCFDKINHDALLTKLNTYPSMRRLIKSWLKAGVMDKRVFSPTKEGTPQGGVISPLLANIALHGMEHRIWEHANSVPKKKTHYKNGLGLVRYADDFVIMHPDQTVIEDFQKVINDWLNDMGLELKPSKTKISHTMDGFDFLGFNVKQYKVGKNHSKQGFKTIIKPSKEKVQEHYGEIADVIERHKAAPQKALISHLKPKIRGWCNYYSTVCSKETFNDLGNLLWNKLQRWGYRRHPKKSKTWVNNKYWGTVGNNKWVFKDGDDYLPKHVWKEIKRHVKVQETRSPYDGDSVYWSTRMGKHPEMTSQKARLLKRQKGKCAHCGLTFREKDLMEKHHILPKALGGKDSDKNLELLHLHCHDAKHGKKNNSTMELDANPW
ncbi:MAG: group II intron reverse transcriptase/maturase [Moorea sp. SIO3I7]|uniref:group II intron reverse transcriptase/maturase n=1 Tax=unclassified Moorena TaxID=2683338 RepID=UPI0013C1D6F5|nr:MULTISPECIES: group II intron reverse transcriptase/maturase [unclassified Moorena]NEN99529.1 group II intron reverse transcriptase/maturase [Moorena sp. SIO3I7]NEO08647.1 group II intron reverse transcriptase/maturase [Moorena sp. SIO3I8]NEP27670.1 group II intron reverse transcriptase/maturase [Moorena sp. SIO3I6]